MSVIRRIASIPSRFSPMRLTTLRRHEAHVSVMATSRRTCAPSGQHVTRHVRLSRRRPPHRASSSSLSPTTMLANDYSVPGSARGYECNARQHVRRDPEEGQGRTSSLSSSSAAAAAAAVGGRRRWRLSTSSMSSSDDKVVMGGAGCGDRTRVEDVLPLGHDGASGRLGRDVGADVVVIAVP